MARRESISSLRRRLANEEARRNYDRPIPDPGPVAQRRPTTDLYYRSLLRTDGAVHANFRVAVDTDALTQIGGATLVGLLDDIADGETSQGTREQIKPSRIHWYKGVATPQRETNAWGGASYNRYYDRGSHRSVPVSRATGIFTAADIRAAFTALFLDGAESARPLMGPANGRAWLELEQDLALPAATS